MASIRHLLPDILAARNSGHTLKRVCRRLNELGIDIKYKTLSAYVGILRREQSRRSTINGERKPQLVAVPEPVRVFPTSAPAISRPSPLATAMEYLGKVRGFQNFTGEPPDPDKIF
jgi:hypothetical protein